MLLYCRRVPDPTTRAITARYRRFGRGEYLDEVDVSTPADHDSGGSIVDDGSVHHWHMQRHMQSDRGVVEAPSCSPARYLAALLEDSQHR
jgi:hypothetical protein